MELNIFQKKLKKFIENKNIITIIYRLQAHDSIMCGYFCIGFIDFMLKGKSMLDYTKLFSLNEYEKNDKIIKKLFLRIDFQKVRMKKRIKYHIFVIKHYFFLVLVTNVEVKMLKYLRKKNQLKY